MNLNDLDTTCCICFNEILTYSTGEPHLSFKNRPICFGCYIDLIPEIYQMAGHGDGGIIHYIFQWCLKSNHNRKTRKTLSKYIFRALLHKYNFKCVGCGTDENLTIDHIKPVSKGGSDDFNNLQILCKSCNSKKGAKWNEKAKEQNSQ
jgi:hypothetical protein